MNIRAIIYGTALVVSVAAVQPAVAQQGGIQIGRLQCTVDAGLGLVVASSKNMRCIFTSLAGHGQEWYVGTIRKFGLDIGATDRGVLIWDVIAAKAAPPPGALAGEYVGGGASATFGAGVGANALVGGNSRSFALQPLSTQAQTGLNVAGGVAEMKLLFAR